MSFEDFSYFDIEIGNTYQEFLHQELSMLRLMNSKNYWREVNVNIDQISKEDFDLNLLEQSDQLLNKKNLEKLYRVLHFLDLSSNHAKVYDD